MNPQDFLTQDPNVAGGQVVFRGTRVPLRSVLASLAEGEGFDAILRAFPSLTEEHLRAAVAFAATSSLEDQLLPATPSIP